MIVTQVKNGRHLVDQGRVAEAGANRIDTTFEGAEFCSAARVCSQLTVVVSNNAHHKTGRELVPHRPFGMKLVAAAIVGRGISKLKVNPAVPLN